MGKGIIISGSGVDYDILDKIHKGLEEEDVIIEHGDTWMIVPPNPIGMIPTVDLRKHQTPFQSISQRHKKYKK